MYIRWLSHRMPWLNLVSPQKLKDSAEMEYCASAASMLAEEIWQIVEVQICRLNLRNVEEMSQMINNAESHS